jgi:hypothetical protein
MVETGGGIEGATEYADGTSPHPVVLLGPTSSALHPLFQTVPDGWRPLSIGEIQLVAVIESEWVEVENCGTYLGHTASGATVYGTVVRERHAQLMTLYEAATGQEVAVTTLQGAEPRACEEFESIIPNGVLKIRGEEVSDDQALTWLSNHIGT